VEEKVFVSAVDWWLGLLLAAIPLATLGAAGSSLLAGELGGAAAMLVTTAFVLLLYGGLVLPMRYTLKDDHLEIRFGLARSRVPYASLKAVTPTLNPLSSPALSLRRLHLDAGSRLGPNISPKDRPGFLAALAERAPHLKLEGDRLVAAGGE